MEKRKTAFTALWFSIGLASGIFLTKRLIGARSGSARPISHLPAWKRALASKYGLQKAVLWAAKVQARYELLFAARPRFRNPALRTHLEAHILPGIALYQVLKEEVGDPLKALADIDICFSAHAQASSMAQQASLLDLLPGGFTILRLANRTVLRTSFPDQGWQIEWVEDSPDCIAYNITACFYLNVLSAYGVPELTAHFCALDDQLYGNLKTIAWERTETLGRGNARCNFVFRRLNQATISPR
jgi:hypothetical protein